ncbi:hypothetical protein FRB95_002565 [Tulasnella sp. JGI-2019a]|nr:hypothetical protein FRB95_002565 [Tulasnella sp. JGI-2019a]
MGEWQNEDLDTCLERLTTKVLNLMIKRNWAHNRTRPLNRLPIEILVKVLTLALQYDVKLHGTYMKNLRIFASVSHGWLLLVKGTPSLWKVVASDQPIPLLRQVLSRSKGHLLDVVYPFFPSKIIPIDPFTSLVVEHVHRWRSLIAWDYSSACDTFQRLIHLSAPMLEVLDCWGMNQAVVDLFSGEASRLLHVELRGVCIPWESKMLSGLQKLNLERMQLGSPSGHQLLAILAASPGLIELRLSGFNDSSPSLPQTVSVELPMLETLGIMEIPQLLTHDLLSAIHIPRCTSFEISYSQEPNSDVGLFNDPILAHIRSLLVTHIEESPRVIMAWRHEGMAMNLFTSMSAATILFTMTDDDWDFTVPGGLLNALEEAGPTEIHLKFCCINDIEPSTILQLLGPSQSRITEISMLNLDVLGPRDLMQFLGEPTMVDGVAQWPLSRLGYLSLEGCHLEREDVLAMVCGRYGGISGSRQEGTSSVGVLEPCVPFHLNIQEFDIEEPNLTSEDVDELRRVLGYSNLTYVLGPY